MWRWITSLVLIAVVAAIAVIMVVAGTERGAAWLAAEAESLTGGAVRLDDVQGTLISGLRVARVQVRAGTTTVRGEQIVLRLRAAELLRGRISIAELGAQRIDVELPAGGQPESKPFRMPTIATPLPVAIDALDIALLRIGQGESALVIAGVHFAGALANTRLTAREIHATFGELAVRASGTADLRDRLPLDALVQWRLRDPALSGTGVVRGDLAVLDIRHWLRVPDAIATIAIKGRLIDVVDAPRLEAEATWKSLGMEVAGLGLVQANGGRAQFSGWLGEWRAQLAASLVAPSLPPAQVQAGIHGDESLVVVDDLRLDGGFGAVAARGQVWIDAPRRMKLAIAATNIDTAAFRAGLNGRLSARADLDAGLPGAVRLTLHRIDGRLMGRPLAGSGELGYRDGTLHLANVALNAGSNRLRADGQIGKRLAGTFTLEAPQLGVLWPGLGGSVSAQAIVAGTAARPVIDLDATGRSLALNDNRLERLESRVTIDRSGRVDARLQAHGVVAGDVALGDLLATLDGTLAAHRFAGELSRGLVDVRLSSAGSWTGSALHHRLVSASVAAPEAGEWRLDGEPELSLGAKAIAVGAHCWEQPPASLCLSEIAWSPGRTRAAGEIRDLDLQRFGQWVPADLAVTGQAEASAMLDLTPSGITGTLTSRLVNATVYYTGGDEPLVTVLQSAELDARFMPDEATASIDLAGDSGLRLAGTGRMRAPLGATAPLDAEIRGELPDIAPLVPWLAPDLDLAEVAGGVTLDAAVSGTLQSPQWTGVARLSRGAVALPDVGVKFEDIDIALLGDGSATVRVQGSARAGGPLTLAGAFSPLEPGGPQGWLRVRGNSIDAVKIPDRFVKASPDITVHYAAGRISTDGSITIPKADIVVRALPESAASPSPDATVRDRAAASVGKPAQQPIGGEVALILGRNVRLRAFGLDTQLEGTLKLSQGSDGEPRGYGVVRLKEGKFGAYGKELIIERGTLGFTGPLDDPAVDIRASRRVDWEGKRVTAGLLLTGTATRPESRVFSDPAMSEADALSYLISGRPMQSTNQTDRSAIAGAALSLGVQQTSPITESIGSAVALDELGMEGGTLDEAEVVAGKQLGSDLYVRFTYGVFSRIGTLIARYKLGRNVSIEAASGEAQSLDLIYSIERE